MFGGRRCSNKCEHPARPAGSVDDPCGQVIGIRHVVPLRIAMAMGVERTASLPWTAATTWLGGPSLLLLPGGIATVSNAVRSIVPIGDSSAKWIQRAASGSHLENSDPS